LAVLIRAILVSFALAAIANLHPARAQSVEWRVYAERTSGELGYCPPLLHLGIKDDGKTWMISFIGAADFKPYAVPLGPDGSANVVVFNPNTLRSGRYIVPAGKGKRGFRFEQEGSDCAYNAVPE
jgi:hypothetical protein